MYLASSQVPYLLSEHSIAICNKTPCLHFTHRFQSLTSITSILQTFTSPALTYRHPVSFQTGLDAFKTYLESLTGNEKSFDASHLNEIINTFEPALHSHLQTEIQDLLALEKYGDNLPIKKLWDKEGKHAVVRFRHNTYSSPTQTHNPPQPRQKAPSR